MFRAQAPSRIAAVAVDLAALDDLTALHNLSVPPGVVAMIVDERQDANPDDGARRMRAATWIRIVFEQRIARAVAVTGVVFILLAWGTLIWQVIEDRSTAISTATRENSGRVMAFSQYMQRVFEIADLTAGNVERDHADTALRPSQSLGPPETIALPSYFDGMILGAALYDADGRLRATDGAIQRADVRNRAEFQHLKRYKSSKYVIFSPVHDPSSVGLAIMAGRAVRGPDGQFRGMVGVDLAVRHMVGFSAMYHSHPDEAFALVGHDGVTLLERQGAVTHWGDMRSDWVRKMRHGARAPDGRIELSRVDGRRRIISIERLTGWPAFVVSAIGEEAALAPSLNRAGWFLSMATILTLMVGALMVLFFRHIYNAELAQQRINMMRDELAHSARVASLSEMAAGLAHELNQPLTAASNYLAVAELGQAAEGPPDAITRQLALVRGQITRAGEIIRRIRDFLAKGNAELRSESISATIIDAIELARGGYSGPATRLIYLSRSRDALVSIDRVQIQQVLVNLIRNAEEAVADLPQRRRVVRIRWVPAPDDMIEVLVDDDGPGFPYAVLEKFNLPFISTKGEHGMGIGLSICRRIIEVHGGALRAVNLQRGASVSFTVHTVSRAAAHTAVSGRELS